MSTAVARTVQSDTPPPSQIRTPEFTLGRALAWLGHQCTDRCSVTLDMLGVRIWFIQQPSPRLLPDDTFIVLDLAASVLPAVQLRRLLRQIDACAGAEGISVCARCGDDHAGALAAVADDPDGSKFGRELVGVASALDSQSPRRPGYAAAGGI